MITLRSLIPHRELSADVYGHLSKFISIFDNQIDNTRQQCLLMFTHNPFDALCQNLIKIASNLNIELYTSMTEADKRFHLFHAAHFLSCKGTYHAIVYLFKIIAGAILTMEIEYAKSFDHYDDITSLAYDPENVFANSHINTQSDCCSYAYDEDSEETTVTAKANKSLTETQMNVLRYVWLKYMPPILLTIDNEV